MKNRSLPLCIILSVLTLGIFYLYWFYRITKEIIVELKYEKIDNPVLNLIYLIFGLCFYNAWWNYKVSAYLATLEKNNKIQTDFWATPLSVLYGVILHQSRMNRILATKYKPSPTRKRKKTATEEE